MTALLCLQPHKSQATHPTIPSEPGCTSGTGAVPPAPGRELPEPLWHQGLTPRSESQGWQGPGFAVSAQAQWRKGRMETAQHRECGGSSTRHPALGWHCAQPLHRTRTEVSLAVGEKCCVWCFTKCVSARGWGAGGAASPCHGSLCLHESIWPAVQ